MQQRLVIPRLSSIIGTAYSVGAIASIIAPTPTLLSSSTSLPSHLSCLVYSAFTLPNTPVPTKGKPPSVRDLVCLEAQRYRNS